MLENIPQKRLLIYALLAGLLPIVFAGIAVLSKWSSLQDLENNLQLVQESVLTREKKQAINVAVRNNFRDADHFYIDKHLETLTFLEPEIESLQKISSNTNYPEDENIKRRIEYLTGSGNAMAFSEGVVQTSPLFQETTETLIHPVEINTTDLQKILALIEGVDIGPYKPVPNRPQLIILDFKLDKKNVSEKNEVFSLNLKLLKREYL